MSDRFDMVQLIGDELHFAGELVAILTTNAPATHRGRFEDLVRDGEEVMEPCKCPPRLHHTECRFHKAEDGSPDDEETVLDALWSKATDAAKGGLLRMPDLANIIARLKEDK